MDDTREFQIQLIYDGPMVSRGRIPAIAVGEGIVGMAKMVSRAGNILSDQKNPVESAIEPRISRGSCEINFIFNLTFDLVEIGIFSLVFTSLFGHLRRERRGPSMPLSPSRMDALVSDHQLRKALGGLVRPLDGDRVDHLTIGDRYDRNEFEPVRIEHHEASLFRGTGVISRTEEQRSVFVIKPSFRRETVWTLADELDGPTFSAYMDDYEFMDRVAEGRTSFHRGTRIHVVMRTTVSEQYGRWRTRRQILRVYGIS